MTPPANKLNEEWQSRFDAITPYITGIVKDQETVVSDEGKHYICHNCGKPFDVGLKYPEGQIICYWCDEDELRLKRLFLRNRNIKAFIANELALAYQSGLTAGREEAIKKVNKLLNEEAQKENSIFLENAITFLKNKLEALTQKKGN